MELAGRKVVVVGLGRSGRGAVSLCHHAGATVVGTDSRPASAFGGLLEELPAELTLGGHDLVDFRNADLIVVSPGVPPMAALDAAAARGVPVISELELSCGFVRCPIVAIGGTNGKSTTTVLIAQILEAAGSKVFAGGNLGAPLCEAVGLELDVAVVEVSSFQLERVEQFRPKTGLLLNISEDHLDRYTSFEEYADAKGNAFINQQPDDFAIVPANDELCRRQVQRGRGRVVTFGPDADYAVRGRTLLERATGDSISLESVQLYGRHNLDNVAAAVAAARSLEVGWSSIDAGLSAFEALPHRMRLVRQVAGVAYYDDSKATNVGAAVTAIEGLEEAACVLIAGGRDKHGSYAALVDALRRRGRAVVLIGEAAERLERALGETLPTARVESMQDAVALAARLAQSGDAVLLSPACSSFDMYSGYAERGEDFARCVLAL